MHTSCYGFDPATKFPQPKPVKGDMKNAEMNKYGRNKPPVLAFIKCFLHSGKSDFRGWEKHEVLKSNRELETVYKFRVQLQDVWGRAAANHDTLVVALKDWCARAEETGIKALQEFAIGLRRYSLGPVGSVQS